METEGTYRALASPRADDEWLLLDVASTDPTYVPATGYEGDLADAVAALEPGNRVAAALEWVDGTPRFAALEIETGTRVRFVRTTEPMFQAAERCWASAVEAGEGMNARVTRGTDGEPNGVVYTFARQPGQRDLFAEFRDGAKPLDPLLARAAESVDPPFDVTVLDHPDHPFVPVYIVFDPDSFLAETVRDTYPGDEWDASGGGSGDGSDGGGDGDGSGGSGGDGGADAGGGGSLADRLE